MIIPMGDRGEVRRVHRGRLLALDVLSWTDGAGRRVEREVVRHPGAVLVVPQLDDGRVVLIRNFRVAVDQALWELPAGSLGPGEDPRRAAARELAEETGYVAEAVDPLGEFYTSPGFCDELMRVYCARGLRPAAQRLEPGEEIEVRVLPLAEALRMIDDGRIRDGKTIAGLLLWVRRGGAEGGP
jgi:ADP-ribose pyrophosphatase